MFRRGRKASDFSAEIETHLQHETGRLQEQGLSEAEARAAARCAFGNVLQAEERFYESGRWLWWDHFWQDVRFGLRMLGHNPSFAVVAVLTLALGMAINATMFSMVSGFLLRRPPGREPDRVVVVTSVNPASGFQADATPISAPNYLAWREASRIFADAAAADEFRSVSLAAQSGQPEALRSAAVSPSYFSVLGVAPEIGRTFVAGEDQAGHDHVVILGHDLWVRRFGADPSIVSRTIRLNREDYDVVGVMPADFRMLGFTPQLWTPLVLSAADQTAAARNNRSLYMFARLKPGISLKQVRAEVATLAQRAESSFPQSEKGWGAAVRTLPDFLVYVFSIVSALVILMTTVSFVLLIACANVSGLLLARGARRRKELAIRMSLGAGRLRVVRQLLTEGLMIALLGGAAGLLLSYWGVSYVRASLVFNEAIAAVPIHLDWNVVLYTLGVSVACAAICGVVPAMKAARTDPNTSLKDEGRAASAGRSQNRLRSVMVTGEIALALLLLVGTGLLLRGIFLLDNQELGFQPDPLLSASVTLDATRYPNAEKQLALVDELLRHTQQFAGADAVAITSDLPAMGGNSMGVRIKGQPELRASEGPTAVDFLVTPDYFRAAGIPLLRGRNFTETDNGTAPRVGIVNREFVRRYFPDREPLGEQISLNGNGGAAEWCEIVGVVGNVKTYAQETRDEPEVYEAFRQRPVPSFSVLVRAHADPNGLAPALRSAVAQIDAELPLSHLQSMRTMIDLQKGGNLFFSHVMTCFASLALLLAAIGIYGLVAYSVGQRTHEIGIRMALGANTKDVLRMILWQGFKMAAVGTAIGLALAFPLPRIFDAMFAEVRLQVHEPRLYLIVPVAVVVIALFATYLPARRALNVEPIAALRHD